MLCYPFIPTLAQFIVRALDPTQPQQRRALLKHTSLLIHTLINTYPNISFDKTTQRLIVSSQTHNIATSNNNTFDSNQSNNNNNNYFKFYFNKFFTICTS
eukprot:UN01382